MKFVDITNNLRMKQIVTLALLVLCSVTFYFNDLRANRNYVVDIFENTTNLFNDTNKMENTVRMTEVFKSDKWIVITSISYPTDDIKRMAEFPDWKIVVVGDKKSPNDWKYKNCIFLSVEYQKSLNYEISSLLQYNSYTRKMIGYLYAIQHGAKFIYDTDDDNLPIGSGINLFDFSNVTSGVVGFHNSNDTMNVYNVYSHFGRPNIWPRGFPLENIIESNDISTKLCGEIKTPLIQQGLVNQDADVDAIYRLINVNNKKRGLNVSFDSSAPPIILSKNIYCPFNSQNTLFHYDAFWALLLPNTVAFRVTDIWRGYWAQRLLHITGNYMAFYPPNARQVRNAHNYLKDFKDETQLYNDAGKLLETITNWHCSSNEFSECITELSDVMASNNFWGYDDVKLTKAWINDLIKIGYVFPQTNETVFTCPNVRFVSSLIRNTQSTSYKINNLKKLISFCQPFLNNQCVDRAQPINFRHTKNVNLIVVINQNNFVQIPLLQLFYESYFMNVIFCATFPSNLSTVAAESNIFQILWIENGGFSYINLTSEEMGNGYFLYMCLNKAASMNFKNIDGFLVIADDMLLNFWNPFNTTNIVFPKDCDYPAKEAAWMESSIGLPALTQLKYFLDNNSTLVIDHQQLLQELSEITLEPMKCISDIYYVPQRFMEKYKILSQLFYDHKVFLEIAVPKILYLLGWAKNGLVKLEQAHFVAKKEQLFEGVYLWNYGETRGGIVSFDSYNNNDTFLHPVKWSFINNIEWRERFCSTYITSLLQNTVE